MECKNWHFCYELFNEIRIPTTQIPVYSSLTFTVFNSHHLKAFHGNDAVCPNLYSMTQSYHTTLMILSPLLPTLCIYDSLWRTCIHIVDECCFSILLKYDIATTYLRNLSIRNCTCYCEYHAYHCIQVYILRNTVASKLYITTFMNKNEFNLIDCDLVYRIWQYHSTCYWTGNIDSHTTVGNCPRK